MKKDSRTPWAYRKGKGLMYRIPAGIKLIFFLCLSTLVFFMGYFLLPFAGFVIIVFSVSAGIHPWELLSGGAALCSLCFGIIMFQSLDFPPLGFSSEGFKEGILLGLRMGLSFSTCALLFSTTTMGEIQRSLSSVEGFLRLKKLRLSLGISLMLGFLPRFFEVWEDTELAWKSRAGKKGLSKLIFLIPLVLDRMMEKAAETAEALESRGF
jgi:biotin transport system permease protein